jgi:D-erythrulose 1-phosphate 3-epimerase
VEVRLGINTCFAVKRWPRPEDWAPIIAGRLGLRLVQHSLDLEDGRRVAANGAAGAAEGGVAGAAAILAAASEHGLTVHSTFTGLGAYSRNLLLDPEADARQAARSYLRAAIDLTAALGGVATGGHVGAFSVVDWTDPARRTARWADLRSSLAELAMDARRAGLEYLMVENLAAAREPSTMAMIRDLLTEGDTERVPIRLCLDVGHMCVPGTAGPDRDPYAWLRELGAAAPVVQLQQSDAGGDHHWPFTPARNAEGRIDARRVLEALVDGGVAETALILEVIPAFEQDDDEVLDDLERSADHWREALVASRSDVV